MDKQDHTSIFEALDMLLQREKRALLEGAFEDLIEIGTEKTRLLEALEAISPAERAPLKALHEAAGRNQTLLESALAGIRDVAARMTLLRQVRDSLQTYDAHGQKNEVYLATPGKLEKRA
ncbi:MAG: hypothetical protein GYB25_01375 [Rhodobacteraceae bacterium]|nr:hypothetical protein [Paracoccaceae bacterium]